MIFASSLRTILQRRPLKPSLHVSDSWCPPCLCVKRGNTLCLQGGTVRILVHCLALGVLHLERGQHNCVQSNI